MSKRVTISVAEHSADVHAANFVRALKSTEPEIEVEALGGTALESAGATLLADTVSNAAMGLKAYQRTLEVKRLLSMMDEQFRTRPPSLHVCCDSWTMNYHFAKLARSHGIPVLYYIAPQAWASREGRVRKLAQVADKLACILPFEEAWFRERGVDATWVGHPLFDEIDYDTPPLGITGSPRIALPCGSRKAVVRANLPRQLEVARLIKREFPDARFVIPATSNTRHTVEEIAQGDDAITIVTDEFDAALNGCDLAVCVSGTATLHVAAHRVPMVVVYAGSRFLWHTVGRFLIKTRTFAQVNLLANDGRDDRAAHIVPEFVPWNGSVEPVATACIELLKDASKLNAMKRGLDAMVQKVGQPGASQRVSRLALDLIG